MHVAYRTQVRGWEGDARKLGSDLQAGKALEGPLRVSHSVYTIAAQVQHLQDRQRRFKGHDLQRW